MDFAHEGLSEGNIRIMTLESALMENDLFFEPEDGYWTGRDKLAFEAEHMATEWPVPDSLFIRRMAKDMVPGRCHSNLALSDFKLLVGAMVDAAPRATYQFLVIPKGPSCTSMAVAFLEKRAASLPPLRADNACSLDIALPWMAKRHAAFKLSFSVDATYWIHKI